MTSLGLAIIARDEEAALPTLLDSISGHFDHVSLLDTGSKDQTLRVFDEWARAEHKARRLGSWSTGTDTSCNGPDGKIRDFSAARNAAHALIPPVIEWHVWADCDDVIVNPQALRQLAENADPQATGFMFDYDYFFTEQGDCVSVLARERLFRAQYGQCWEGRVHECVLLPPGTMIRVSRDIAYWSHTKHLTRVGASNPRNIAILKQWAKDEPDSPRVVGYLGTELLVGGKVNEGAKWIRRYLKLTEGELHDERAQFLRKLSVVHLTKNENDKAAALARQAIAERPTWTDSYLTLAEAFIQQGRGDEALFYAEQVLAMGQPESILILNPLDYTARPRIVRALALQQKGALAEAQAEAGRVLALMPENPHAREVYEGTRSRLKFDQTAETWCSMADTLIAHDEQLKAIDLLDTVPHYAQHHPRVVAMKALLRDRVGWAFDNVAYDQHYEVGGSKPEDFVTDVDAVGNSLSRSQAALAEIVDLVAEAA